MASPGLVIDLSSSYGVAYWGVFVSAVLYGCIIIQGYLYLSNYPNDSLILKLFVGTMIIVDGALTLLAAEALNYVLVNNYGNASVLLTMPNSYLAEYAISWVVVTTSEVFYASRIYIVNRKVWYIPAIIVFLAFGSQVSAIMIVIKDFQVHRLMSGLSDREYIILSSLAGGMSSVADGIAAVAMCYYLASRRSEFRKTKQLIKTLIFYTVNRGILVSLCQIAVIVAFVVSPTDVWWAFPHMFLTKLHVITLVSLLNARSKTRHQSDDNALSIIAREMPALRVSRKNDIFDTAYKPDGKNESLDGPSDPCVFTYKSRSALTHSSDRSEESFAHVIGGDKQTRIYNDV